MENGGHEPLRRASSESFRRRNMPRIHPIRIFHAVSWMPVVSAVTRCYATRSIPQLEKEEIKIESLNMFFQREVYRHFPRRSRAEIPASGTEADSRVGGRARTLPISGIICVVFAFCRNGCAPVQCAYASLRLHVLLDAQR
jgi:hypothetical protein